MWTYSLPFEHAHTKVGLKCLKDLISCACAASDEEINECFTHLRIHFESFISQTSDLTMKALPAYPGPKAFLDAHCNYVF